MARYSFGDDRPAVARLRLVAAAYEPVSRAFIAEHVDGPVAVAVDLGCGPGFSTRLLGEVTKAGDLVGVDSSPEFIEVAKRTAPGARFITADLSRPIPSLPPGDVLYARLLLAHMADPLDTVRRWRALTAPGGTLLIEDLVYVEAPPGPLRQYEELSSRVVRTAGGVMYGGEALGSLGGRLVAVTVTAGLAAQIYLYNVTRWIADPGFASDRSALIDLAAALDQVGDDDGTVSWVVRQLALDGA